jgi:endoglucanase Acf2
MNHIPTIIRSAEFSRVIYAHTVQAGNDFDKDVLNEKYWCHLAKVLKVGDQIEVTAHDGTYFALLYVTAVYNAAVRVVCLSKVDLVAQPESDQDDNAEYKIQYRKGRQWCIVRLSDSMVIKDQIQTKEDAHLELAGYMKALAA